ALVRLEEDARRRGRRDLLPRKRDLLGVARGQRGHLRAQLVVALGQARVLLGQSADLRLLRVDLLALDAHGQLAPAPQRQEQRGGGGQPPGAAEAAAGLDDVVLRFAIHHAFAQLLGRRDRVEAARQQRDRLGVLVADAAAFLAVAEVL